MTRLLSEEATLRKTHSERPQGDRCRSASGQLSSKTTLTSLETAQFAAPICEPSRGRAVSSIWLA